MAEWTKKREPVSCPFAKNKIEKYKFDVTKANKIFDLLLQEGKIKLFANHTISSAAELKNNSVSHNTCDCRVFCMYCKWHNVVSHNTNECRVFCRKIQLAIEEGRIKFEIPTKPIKIDGHPFLAKNMVEVED